MLGIILVLLHPDVERTLVRIMVFGFRTEIGGHFCFHLGDKAIEPIPMGRVNITRGKIRSEADDQGVEATEESTRHAQ